MSYGFREDLRNWVAGADPAKTVTEFAVRSAMSGSFDQRVTALEFLARVQALSLADMLAFWPSFAGDYPFCVVVSKAGPQPKRQIVGDPG